MIKCLKEYVFTFCLRFLVSLVFMFGKRSWMALRKLRMIEASPALYCVVPVTNFWLDQTLRSLVDLLIQVSLYFNYLKLPTDLFMVDLDRFCLLTLLRLLNVTCCTLVELLLSSGFR